jgi:hypothetical protein
MDTDSNARQERNAAALAGEVPFASPQRSAISDGSSRDMCASRGATARFGESCLLVIVVA